MPWEIALHLPTDEPLGSREVVTKLLSTLVPSIEWHIEPPLPDTALKTYDEDIRTYLSQPRLRGYYASGRLVIEFFGFESVPLISVHGAVRGTGDPIKVLKLISEGSGWIVTDVAEGKQIDLNEEGVLQWQSFQSFRDSAVREVLRMDPDLDF